jgi:hypothetical protein
MHTGQRIGRIEESFFIRLIPIVEIRCGSIHIFLKWGCPSLYIKEMHTALLYFNYIFNKDWQQALQLSYKLKPRAKVSKHHSTSTMHRGLDQALCLDHRHRRLPCTFQRKRLVRKLQRLPPPLSPCTLLQATEAPPLSRLSIDATATSEDASTLRESTKPHPTPKPRRTSPLRVDISDEGDAHRSATGSLQPEPTSKDDAHKWDNTAARCHHPTRETRI